MTLPLRTSLFKGHISRLLLLACSATAAAATVMGVKSLIWQTSASYYFEISSTCDSLQPRIVDRFGPVRFTDDSGWRTERCREYLRMMMVRTDHIPTLALRDWSPGGQEETSSVNLAFLPPRPLVRKLPLKLGAFLRPLYKKIPELKL